MENVSNQEIKQFIVFKLGSEEYGIDILHVQNIERVLSIARVPKAPFFIKGVINLRGEIIPVMSLRLKFNLEADEFTDDTRIIIVRIDDSQIGMIVDEVKEVLQLSTDSIENVQGVSGITSDIHLNFIQGVGKVNNNIVTLLNIKNLIDSISADTVEVL